MPTVEEYWDALREKVCLKCVDGDGKGNCLIAKGTDCALKVFLPQILEAVSSVQSSSMVPFEERLRSRICAHCIHQNPAGVCAVRDDVDCALDRYYPLIVQVIEETRLRSSMSA